MIKVKWIPTEDNSTDLFTKNLFGPLFEKHASVYVGVDKYMQYVYAHDAVGVQKLQGESVGDWQDKRSDIRDNVIRDNVIQTVVMK